MHAADQLCSPRSVRTNELIDRPAPTAAPPTVPAPTATATVAVARRAAAVGRQPAVGVDPRAAADRPRGGAARGAGAIDEAHTRAAMGSEGSDAEEAHSLLQLVCGDATVALHRYKECIHHYQRYLAKGASPLAAHQYQSGHAHLIAQHHASHLATRQRWQGEQMQLPLDAQLEYICSMLVESYPAAQVMQAAEDGCLFEGHLHEGWLLLSKVLSELIDVDDAIEQAQEEENRHMVNKLLMMLGTNVHNKREKDARMQRMLQEGQDSSQQEESKADSSRKKKGGRKGADDSLLQISHAELKGYWNSLPLAERAALCHVPRDELEAAVHALVAALTRGREDAAAQQQQQQQGRQQTRHQQEQAAAAAQQSQPELLIQVFSILMEPNALDFMNAENAVKAEREAAAAGAPAAAAGAPLPTRGRRRAAVARRRGGRGGDRVRRQHGVADPRGRRVKALRRAVRRQVPRRPGGDDLAGQRLGPRALPRGEGAVRVRVARARALLQPGVGDRARRRRIGRRDAPRGN